LAAGLCPLTLSEPNATMTREDKWLERRKFDRFTVFDDQLQISPEAVAAVKSAQAAYVA
jgi:hypothetical protein